MDKENIYLILLLVGMAFLMLGLIMSAQSIAEHHDESNNSSDEINVDDSSNDEEPRSHVIMPVSGSDGTFAVI